MSLVPTRPIKVFISHSPTTHKERVLKLSDRLHDDSINCTILRLDTWGNRLIMKTR